MTGCMGGLAAQAILEEGEGRGERRSRRPPRRLRAGQPLRRAPGPRPPRAAGPERHPGQARARVRPASRRDQRRALRRARRRRGAPLPVVHQDGPLARGGEGAPPRLERDVPEVARGDGPALRGVPGGREGYARDRREMPALAQARRADAPELSRARGVRHGGLLPPRRPRGPAHSLPGARAGKASRWTERRTRLASRASSTSSRR